MTTSPFRYTVPLLSASLTESDALFAAECISKPDQYAGAADRLHHYVARTWQTPYVASFMGGRASLYAIVQALGLQPGDQVLVPAFTCQAVANAFSFHGIQLVFVDIELDTFGMDITAARNAVAPRGKALLLQHTFGLASRDTEALCALAKSQGLYVIEDCAHATGGTYQDRLLGTFGDIAFFSSERSKVVNSVHGGWVITSDPALGEALSRVHSATPEPDPAYVDAVLYTLCREWMKLPASQEAPLPGSLQALSQTGLSVVPQMQAAELGGLFTAQYHLRMPDRIAAIVLQQLRRLPSILARRRAGASRWLEWAAINGVAHGHAIDGSAPTWLRFPILVDAQTKRDTGTLSHTLGCEIGVWFTTPIHPQPFKLPDCPNGMRASQQCVNLPTWLPD